MILPLFWKTEKFGEVLVEGNFGTLGNFYTFLGFFPLGVFSKLVTYKKAYTPFLLFSSKFVNPIEDI